LNKAVARRSPAESALPSVSVIIPTYNRKEELAGLLSSLEKQTLPAADFEIIVVDDGSADDTLFYLKALVSGGKENLFFCYQKNQGPGAARNRGMAMARGTFFAFTDTDCRPLPEWLDELIKPFSDKQVGAVGGAEEFEPAERALSWAIHFCMTSPLTTGGIRGASGKKLARYYPRTFNMAISREAFERTGGFKQLYHGEDIELSFRIKKSGLALLYNEKARVCHHRRSTMKQFFKQLLRMGEARVALASLHPKMLEPLHVVPAAGILLLCLALVLVAFSAAFMFLLKLLLGAALLFAVLLGAAASMTRDLLIKERLKLFFLVPFVFVVQQAAYGIGFYRGLWKELNESVNMKSQR
jgi:GT2 family glycosyltransferase